MPKGRTPYHQMPHLLSTQQTFSGNSMSAFTDPYDGLYHVYSYGTCIALYDPQDTTLYYNERYYSHTTARHQSVVRTMFASYHPNPTVVVTQGEPYRAHRQLAS